jgi:hypothetical protein
LRARELALAVAAALLAAVAAEVLVRLLGVGPQVGLVYREWFEPSGNPRLRYALRPGAADGAHRISAAGHRGDDVPEAPPEGSFRIAAIGDSVTFGFEVRREEAWPQQLAALLAGSAAPGAPRFEVLNFGVTGYDVHQVAERARVLALRYSPHLLVYGYVLNDPQDWSFEGEAIASIAARDAPPAPLRWLARLRIYQLARALFGPRHYRHAPDGTLVREDGTPIALVANDPGFEAALARGEVDYFRALHREAAPRLRSGFQALARAAGEVPVLVAIFPIFPEESPYPLRDVHREVAAEAGRAGFHVVDLLPVYEAAAARFGERRHVGNLLHPNAFGYRVAAHALLFAALAQGLLPEGAVETDRLERGANAALARIAREHVRRPARSE